MAHQQGNDAVLPQLADDLIAVTWALARKLRAEGHVGTGMSLTQLAILGHLERQPGMSSAELARAEMVTPQSINVAVTELRKLGLIDAQASENDGRRLALKLTTAGQAALVETRERRAAWLVTFLEQEMTAEECATLDAALKALRRAGLAARAREEAGMGGS